MSLPPLERLYEGTGSSLGTKRKNKHQIIYAYMDVVVNLYE